MENVDGMNTDTHKCLSALPRKEVSGGGGECFRQGHWLRPAYITHYVFKSVPETLPQRTPHIENNNGPQCLPSAERKKAIAARVPRNTSHEPTRISHITELASYSLVHIC